MSEPQPRPIAESYWVIPGRFLAGEYPGAASEAVTRQRLTAFLKAGFNTFINLTTEAELPPYERILNEEAAEYGLNVQHLRFAIGDFGVPRPSQMQTTLQAIDTALKAGRKVYLHCWGGIGRTGTTVGCYLVQHGKSGEEALHQLAEWWQTVPKSIIYRRSPETNRQMEFIRQWKP